MQCFFFFEFFCFEFQWIRYYSLWFFFNLLWLQQKIQYTHVCNSLLFSFNCWNWRLSIKHFHLIITHSLTNTQSVTLCISRIISCRIVALSSVEFIPFNIRAKENKINRSASHKHLTISWLLWLFLICVNIRLLTTK